MGRDVESDLRQRLSRDAVEAGELLRVKVPAGAQVPDLDTAAERIAAFMDAREVRVTREPQSAR